MHILNLFGFEFDLWFIISLVLVSLVLKCLIVQLFFNPNEGLWRKQGITEVKSHFWEKVSLFKKPIHNIQDAAYKKHGRVYGTFEGNTPSLIVGEPELLTIILKKKFFDFPNHRRIVLGNDVFDNNLLQSEYLDWKRLRPIMSPTFTTGKIKKMATIIKECIDSLYHNLNGVQNESINIKQYFGAFTMDVIAKSAFGVQLNSHQDPKNIFVTKAREVFSTLTINAIIAIALPLWIRQLLWIDTSSKNLSDFFGKVIKDVLAQRNLKLHETHDDFLQLLMEARDKKEMSEKELISQCVLFFLAGYDTTANTLTYTAYNLATNPHVQTQLQKEIDNVWELKLQDDYDTIIKLPYLDACVSETLRLHTILSRIERISIKESKINNINIPKGTIIGIPVAAMHLDEEFFPDPNSYKPERFLPENTDKRNDEAYLPFGGGPRICLGKRFALMETKYALMNIIRHYEFVATDKTKEGLTFQKGSGILQAIEVPLKVIQRES